MHTEHIPINRSDDGELLGFISRDATAWRAHTIFGYTFARSIERSSAEQVVRDQGLTILKGLWQYLDPDDAQWYPCILNDVTPVRVTVVRTNEMGYQDPDRYKRVVLKDPDETVLIKS